MSISLPDENPTSDPQLSSTSLVTRNLKKSVGKVPQSLVRKISHVWRDYSRGQWTIIAETKVVRSLCIGFNELFRFSLVIFFPG